MIILSKNICNTSIYIGEPLANSFATLGSTKLHVRVERLFSSFLLTVYST